MTEFFKLRVCHFLMGFGMLLSLTGAAQQYPVFTQYYFNELVINPAFAGNHVQFSGAITYRNQWVNFPGAPRTFSVSGHSSLYRGKVGVGLLVNRDAIGSYANDHIYGMYSYKLKFPRATLSMGVQAGFTVIGADFSQLDLQSPNLDDFISLKSYKPNFGAGLLYNKKNYFLGFSVPFIINNKTNTQGFDGVISQVVERKYYFLRGGAIFPIDRAKNVKFNPSTLVRVQEGQPLSIDLNGAFVFYDQFSAGVSWRSGDALIGFLDLKLNEKFHFAYSYDLTSSDINKFSNGSHEFMLNYRARINLVHKNLACPSHYEYR